MRLVFLILGFLFFVTGCTFFILYLNLLPMGYTITDFFNHIILGFPGVMFFLGLFLMIITIWVRRGEKR